MKSVIQKLSIPLFIGLFASGIAFSKYFPDPYILPQQFWFLIFSSLLFGILFGFAFFSKKLTKFSLDRMDVIFSFFTLYVLLNYLTRNGFSDIQQEILVFVFYLFSYALIKYIIKYNPDILNKLFHVIVLLSFIQSVYGLMQLSGILPNYMEGFKMGGSFGNPAQYANYLASVLPIAFGIPLFMQNKISKQIKIFYWISLGLILLVLVFTNARTAWIAAIIGIAILMNKRFSITSVFYSKIKSVFIKISVTVIVILLALALTVKLFYFKEDSSIGRIFIWKTTLKIIEENPVWGTGYNTFLLSHNNEQAKYFIENPEDLKNSYLADNVLFAYNDYLEFTSETGLIGIVLFLALLFFTIKGYVRYKRDDELYPVYVSLLCILIMGLFSYPLNSIAIHLIFITCLAILSIQETGKKYTLSIHPLLQRAILFVFTIVLISIFSFEMKRYKSVKEWNKASNMLQKGENEYALNIYKKILPVLQYNGNFLYNYGSELSLLGYYNESLEVLKFCEKKLNDADFYNYLGNTYEGLNNLEEAEKAFLKSSFIIPHKLYPKYRLVYVYAKMNDVSKALGLAKKILEMKPKVESDITKQIKSDMEAFVKANTKL